MNHCNGPLLKVDNLVKRFGGVTAVDQISLQVCVGQIKSIIGPNGAGKTTFFNLISGVLRSDSGGVFLEDQAIHNKASHAIARLGMSRTFQTMKVFGNMTVLENVMVGRHSRTSCGILNSAFRTPKSRREEKDTVESAKHWLDFVGLSEHANQPGGSLPCGRQKVLEIARALATEPKLLLLDEPAAGLNIRETEDLAGLLYRIRDTGVTQILVEHDMSLVMQVSDEVFVLDYGKKVAEGPPAAIQNNPNVIAVYLGEEA